GRYGGSVWLREPHLKQGKGGLRDLQAALWIARVRHKLAGLGEAGERGLLPHREVTAARAARDLLWKLRNELHYATGRRDDRLTFDNQRRAATALGYRDSPTELAIEQLMRETYIALQEIARASDALIDRCAVEDAPRPAGIFGRRPPIPPKPIDNAFQLWQGRVTVHDREVFARRPADLVRIFAVAETYGAPVYSYARERRVPAVRPRAAAPAGADAGPFVPRPRQGAGSRPQRAGGGAGPRVCATHRDGPWRCRGCGVAGPRAPQDEPPLAAPRSGGHGADRVVRPRATHCRAPGDVVPLDVHRHGERLPGELDRLEVAAAAAALREGARHP